MRAPRPSGSLRSLLIALILSLQASTAAAAVLDDAQAALRAAKIVRSFQVNAASAERALAAGLDEDRLTSLLEGLLAPCLARPGPCPEASAASSAVADTAASLI